METSMTLSDLATDLRALNITHLTVQLSPDGFIVAVIPANQQFSVTATDLDLETAVGRTLAIWERIQGTPPTSIEDKWFGSQPKEG
jgi:hypothetical protein